MADGFIVMRRGRATRADMSEALDQLGVKSGEDFAVARAPEGDPDRLKFARDSKTSRKAALANYPRRETQRHRVLLAIANAVMAEQATRAGIATRLQLPDSSVDPRVSELIEGGFVSPSGRQARTKTGHDADVLMLTPKGRDAIEEHGDG